MYEEVDSVINMGWVPLDHTSPSWCVRLYPGTLIYLVPVLQGEHYKNVYKAIPLSVFVSGQKKKPKLVSTSTKLFQFICLFGNYFQTIGPNRLKFQDLIGATLGGIMMKFSEDWFVC